MKIFQFFYQKNTKEKPPSPDEQFAKILSTAQQVRQLMKTDLVEMQRNFVDDLIGYFESNASITTAWFGVLPHPQTSELSLFLGVEHLGQLEAIKTNCKLFKQIHCPDAAVYFVSTEESIPLLNRLKKTSFPFYDKTKSLELERSIMRFFFEEKYFEHVRNEMRQSQIFTISRELDPMKRTLEIYNYTRNGKQFIPLFHSFDMVARCGYVNLPPKTNIVEYDYSILLSMTKGKIENDYVILNPNSPFEVEINAVK
jgi:hypothetical protein